MSRDNSKLETQKAQPPSEPGGGEPAGECAGPPAGGEPAELYSVSVPAAFRPAFQKAQQYVQRYFADKQEDPQRGTVTIAGERYMLVRAASMSTAFFDLVMSFYRDRGEDEARRVASDFLFDLAYTIGKADAHHFHSQMGVTDPVEKLSAGPIHFAFSGWAYVDILPASSPSPDENFFLIYDHPYSFEAHEWRKLQRPADRPVCIMSAGYSSGWCAESYGIPLTAVEISCRARGDERCRFVMAPPSRIQQHVAQHREGGVAVVEGLHAPVEIPELFQRKRLEEALKRERDFVEAILDTVAALVVIMDHEGRIVRFNRTCETLTGRSSAEVRGHFVWDVIPPAVEVAEVRQVVHELAAQRVVSRHESHLDTADGRRRRILWSNTLLMSPDNTVEHLVSTGLDITERREAEEALQASEERYRRVSTLSSDLAYCLRVVGVELQVEWVTGALTRLTGFDTLAQLEAVGWKELVHPQDRHLSTGHLASLVDGRSVMAEYRIRTQTEEIRWVRDYARPVLRPDGSLECIYGALQDITNQKQAFTERRKLEEQLRQSQKMEAVGSLAGGVAHDMNDILGAIMGLATVMIEDFRPGEPHHEDLENILDACERGRALTRNLLGFARKGKLRREAIRLAEVVHEVETLLSRTIPKLVTVKTVIHEALPPIEGDHNQISQALMNVCLNAVDAMDGRGTLTISMRSSYLDGQQSFPFPDLKPGQYVLLEVSDTGEGMTEDVLERAFEPFFTTKEHGRYAGLGLSLVYGTIKSHGGTVRIDSEPYMGTTVTMVLPVCGERRPADGAPDQSLAEQAPRIGVLLVDDEALFRTAGRRMLEKLGCEVFTAPNGRAALDAYRSAEERIDLVILDVLMPVMGGTETLQRLKRDDPELPVVLMSAGQDEEMMRLANEGADAVLCKPFGLRELSELLGRLTGRKASDYPSAGGR